MARARSKASRIIISRSLNNAKNATDFVAGAFGGLERSMSDFFYTGNLDFGGFIDAIKRGLADLAAKAVISVGLNFLGKVFPNLAFADGGLVPGSGGPRADNVLARVSSGEYVIKASSVSKFGSGFFDALNAGQMPNMGGGGFSVDAGLMDSHHAWFLPGRSFERHRQHHRRDRRCDQGHH
jgi:phage-related minor tail protein